MFSLRVAVADYYDYTRCTLTNDHETQRLLTIWQLFTARIHDNGPWLRDGDGVGGEGGGVSTL